MEIRHGSLHMNGGNGFATKRWALQISILIRANRSRPLLLAAAIIARLTMSVLGNNRYSYDYRRMLNENHYFNINTGFVPSNVFPKGRDS